jgi:NAD-dependent dihydropyrimidine dehydrogenase PreA subunit
MVVCGWVRVSGAALKGGKMTYIIAEPCINVKDTACVDVCPVDCIHPKKDVSEFVAAVQLYINPDECIDCGACEPACPVAAIFPEEEVPEKWKQFIQANYDYFKK